MARYNTILLIVSISLDFVDISKLKAFSDNKKVRHKQWDGMKGKHCGKQENVSDIHFLIVLPGFQKHLYLDYLP